MSKSQPSNATVIDKCTQRLQALKSYVTPKAQIAINGVVHKATDVIEIYQRSLDTRAACSTKRAEMKAALSDRAAAEAQRREADRALKAYVVNQFGVSSQEAMNFGFPPPKTAARSVDSKALAVARAKATRKARHTMGRKQKEQIKGTVESDDRSADCSFGERARGGLAGSTDAARAGRFPDAAADSGGDAFAERIGERRLAGDDADAGER